MSYLRNGKRVFTTADKAKQRERVRLPDNNYTDVYRKADREFSLTPQNIQATVTWTLRWEAFASISARIESDQASILKARRQMFATLKWQRTGHWGDDVNVSGYWKSSQAYLYYHTQSLKFHLEIARRLHINASDYRLFA